MLFQLDTLFQEERLFLIRTLLEKNQSIGKPLLHLCILFQIKTYGEIIVHAENFNSGYVISSQGTDISDPTPGKVTTSEQGKISTENAAQGEATSPRESNCLKT